MMQLSKMCTKCGTVKSLDDFYRRARMLDGHRSECKKCSMARDAEHRVNARSRRSELMALWNEKNKQRRAESNAKWRANNDQKLKEYRKAWNKANGKKKAANKAVFMALIKGHLESFPCLICGKKSEAHHPDYDRPLEVVWLCRTHHRQAHAALIA